MKKKEVGEVIFDGMTESRMPISFEYFDGYLAGLSGLPASQEQILNDIWTVGHAMGLADRRMQHFTKGAPSAESISLLRERVQEKKDSWNRKNNYATNDTGKIE